MEQLGLFKTVNHDGIVDYVPTVPLARSTDPDTSHAGAAHAVSKHAKLKAMFRDGLKICGGTATANEAAEKVSDDHAERESIRKRAKECVDDGDVIVLGDRRRCKVSGKPCKVYQLKGRS